MSEPTLEATRLAKNYKDENVASSGLLQPFLVPIRVFSDLTVDFIGGLPKHMVNQPFLLQWKDSLSMGISWD